MKKSSSMNKKIMNGIGKILRYKSFGSFLMFFAMIIFFYSLNPKFLSLRNIKNFIDVIPELGIIILGQAFILIAGEFDLSVGSVFATSSITLSLMVYHFNINLWVAIFISLFLCCLIGAINGLITLKLKIPSFITTLSSKMFWRGMVLVITRGVPPFFPKKLMPLVRILSGETIAIVNSYILYILIGFILWMILENSRYGNWVFAVGSNREMAEKLGINVKKVKLIAFILVAFLAGFAGIMQACRLQTILPTAGEGYALDSIAGAVIGGVSLLGGSGDLVGAVIGAFVIRMMGNGLILIGAPGYYVRIFIALTIVWAVVFYTFIKNKISKMKIG
jgi:simple sugar transport system permease protein